MKYIKTFENLDIPSRRADLLKYNEGDYVLFKAEDGSWRELFLQGKIKDYYLSSMANIYYIIITETEPEEWHISGPDVIRELTTEEIEEYEAKVAAIKYNL